MNLAEQNDRAVFDELQSRLAPHGQEHLLRFWSEIENADRQRLADEIRAIDFSRLSNLRDPSAGKTDWAALARRAEPPIAVRLGQCSQAAVAEAKSAGERALAAGEIGAILVAGGQGTRLGFDHPKGMYKIGPVSGATLFQILLEKILAVGRRYGAAVPLYLMTSPATDAETRNFLDQQHRFGLAADDVHVFCQGVMPAVDAATGKVLLASKSRIALSPDGHGGMLAALDRSGGLADIGRRGIQQLFYFQVDNPLVAMCDPVFLGHHILQRSEISTLAVSKREPKERVGNIVRINGRTQIIEYSDLPNDVAESRNADGSLRFWAGNTAVHVFDVEFLRRVAGNAAGLPFHIARKTVSYVDDRGNLVEPTQPNAMKFERFIFDLLPLAARSIVVETDPTRTFAPVKNAPGEPTDSPESCQAAMVALYRQWLEAAGLKWQRMWRWKSVRGWRWMKRRWSKKYRLEQQLAGRNTFATDSR